MQIRSLRLHSMVYRKIDGSASVRMSAQFDNQTLNSAREVENKTKIQETKVCCLQERKKFFLFFFGW